jgi:hypothetical protein
MEPGVKAGELALKVDFSEEEREAVTPGIML